MDLNARFHSLNQASRELETHHLQLTHRIALLESGRAELAALRHTFETTKHALHEQQAVLARIKGKLPLMARTESLERLNQRLDGKPYEELARSAHPRIARQGKR